MKWEKGISADGATATPDQLAEAWNLWSANPLRTATTLANTLTSVGVVGTAKYWPTARIADRMLQKARKVGAIKFVKGKWEIVLTKGAKT